MIIITENKTQHYLIKNFLTAISNVSLNESYLDDNEEKERYYAGEWPAIKPRNELETEIIDKDKHVSINQLQKASKIKPKMKNLVKLVASGIAVSILAASSYFASDLNNNKVAQDIAQDNNISVQKVIQVSPQINDKENILQFNGNDSIENELNPVVVNNDNIDVEEKTNKPSLQQQTSKSVLIQKSKERIKSFEGFKPYPYKDKTGVSIGYGTFFIDNVKPDSLPKDWRDNLYKKCGLSKKEINQYESQSQDELLKQFSVHIENQKSKIDIVLSRVEDKIKLKNSELEKWEKIRNKSKRKRYTDTVKAEIKRLKKRKDSLNEQKDDLDKEEETANSRGLISIELAEECLSRSLNNSIDMHTSDSDVFAEYFLSIDEDVRTVIIDMTYNIGDYFLEKKYPNFKEFVKEYIEAFESGDDKAKSDALKNMWEEIKDRSPDYHAQQSLNRRAEKNTNLLKLAYERSLKKSNESYSIKNTYLHLFS